MGQVNQLDSVLNADDDGWCETWPPVALHPTDPRYWNNRKRRKCNGKYRWTGQEAPINKHNQSKIPNKEYWGYNGRKRIKWKRIKHPARYLMVEGRIRRFFEWGGRYWPYFKYWHSYLERK
jgi:hypothetical protein